MLATDLAGQNTNTQLLVHRARNAIIMITEKTSERCWKHLFQPFDRATG